VEDVKISKGSSKPIRIGIPLRANAGFFQVENVLCPKINIRPVKGCIELHAGLKGKEPLQYL
jgi:metal-dependent HD superfamily phosphatase/phosphodiesterase